MNAIGDVLDRTKDPLLQPYRLRHLTLRNRVMSTAHEPYYSEDGMPKDRYRLYHVEKARGGMALTMTAGSAVVSPDSPPVFGNLLAYKDEIVPWLRAADEAVLLRETGAGSPSTSLRNVAPSRASRLATTVWLSWATMTPARLRTPADARSLQRSSQATTSGAASSARRAR